MSESGESKCNPADPPKEGRASERERQEPSIVLRTELQIPQAIIDKYETHQNKSDKRDCFKLFLEVLTVVGVLFYGAVAYRQWGQMKEANQIANANALAGDRPWVGPKSEDIRDIVEGKAPSFVVHVQNFGKSPAFSVEGVVTIGYDPIAKSPEELFAAGQKSNQEAPRCMFGTLWPGQVAELTVLGPTLIKEQMDKLATGKAQLAGLAFFSYSDTSGNPHHTWVFDMRVRDETGNWAIVPRRTKNQPPDD